MKKIIFILVFILSFAGCSNASEATGTDVAVAYANDFSASAKAVFGENEATVEIVKNPMSISFFVKSPKELEGLLVEVFDEHAKISYQGMEQEIKKDNLPDGAVFLLLEELFEDLEDGEDLVLSMEDGKVNVNEEDFSAVLSEEDLSLISADFPKYKTSFEFSEFAFAPSE